MIKEIKIPETNKTIGGDSVFIVAEIGKNFIQTEDDREIDEYLDNAKRLIDEAALAGVDAVKFQTHELEDEWHPSVNIPFPHFTLKDRLSWIKRNTEATPLEFWRELAEYAKKKDLVFFSTPMSRKAAEKIEKLVPIWKLASGDVTDYLLIDYMIETGKPIIISSGQTSLSELHNLINYIESHGSKLAVLYCVSIYPAPPDAFNIGTIDYLKEKYPHLPIGFSDHSIESNEPAMASVKAGAKIIEKHFSLSRNLWGADHKVSLTPSEMKELVFQVRSGLFDKVKDKYYGEKDKELDGADTELRKYFGKVLVASKDLPKGTKVTKEMFYAMRPALHLDGVSAKNLNEVLGRPLKRDLSRLQVFKWEYIK